MRRTTIIEQSFDTEFNCNTTTLGGHSVGIPADQMLNDLDVVVGAVKRVAAAADDQEVLVTVTLAGDTGFVRATVEAIL